MASEAQKQTHERIKEIRRRVLAHFDGASLSYNFALERISEYPELAEFIHFSNTVKNDIATVIGRLEFFLDNLEKENSKTMADRIAEEIKK